MKQFTGETLKQLRKERSVKQTDIAELLGVAKQAISKIENGDRGISPSENAMLNAFFFGAMPESVSPTPMPSSLVLHFERSEFRRIQEAARADGMLVDEWAEKQLSEIANMSLEDVIAACREPEPRREADENDNITPFPLATVPCYPVAAGKPITGDEDTAEIPAHLAADHFAVRVFGDSMEPEVKDGSIAIIMDREKLKRPMLKKGFIYTFVIDGEATLKRYNTRKATKKEIEGGKSYVSKVDGVTKVKVLESLNPAYPEIVLCPEDEPQMTGWYNPEVQL